MMLLRTVLTGVRRSTFVAGVAVLFAAGCDAASAATTRTAPVAAAPADAAIWFHPLPGASAWPQGPPGLGSTDFLDLFRVGAPWVRVQAHTGVFGMYAGWVLAASDAELRQTFAFLNARRMAVELEVPALEAEATCGSGIEGFVPPGTLHSVTLAYLERLKSFGADVRYLKVDEPLWFGAMSPTGCRFSVPQVAVRVAAFARLVRTVYPSAQIGDVEPIVASAYQPNVVVGLGYWHDVYRAASGAPFPFFFADIDFSNPDWPAIVRQVEAQTQQSGLRFGIIYIGDRDDVSDAEWAGKAVARFRSYQGAFGGRPDYVLFQSWERHPERCLPESDAATFTGAIATYIDTFWRAPR